MQCDIYEKHELGEIDQSEYEKHRQDCQTCKQILQQDTQLLELTADLNEQVDSPVLWAKIENQLRAEQRREKPKKVNLTEFLKSHKTAFYRIAAMLVIAVGISTYYLYVNQAPSEDLRILTASALKKVENTERNYEKAIDELEKLAESKFSVMDVDLMLLYRDRLETIDAQIERCKEALAENPANAHIRRYLLAALQDKRDTLQELAAFDAKSLVN